MKTNKNERSKKVLHDKGISGKLIVNARNVIWRLLYRDEFLGYFNENKLRTKEKSEKLETILV